MKNAGAVIAVVSLLLAVVPGRSQESAPGAKCLTLQQRLADWGKVRQVSQTTAMPTPESASPPATDEVVQPSPHAAAMPTTVPASECCLTGPGHRPCWEQLDDWLTYRPLCQSCSDCCPKPVPCCNAPLYAFFIGNCCVRPVAPNPHGAPGHRVACIWDSFRNSRLWPGNVDTHLRQRLSSFFFFLGESCARGDGVPEGNVVETNN
jgi:hypothetical protein